MDGPIAPLGIETLLQHREWVRRVARVLVKDENVADDLEQELWAKTIERPPQVRGSVRGWLAISLRNLFLNRRRAEARRERREQVASRPEGQPPPADVVALAEAHRRVVAAVLDLDEPYRKTVLFRFFEDLSAQEIATREAVPVETVRTRLKRALAILKERFDAKEGGNRRAWQAALLPLSMPSLSIGAVTGTGTAAVVGGLVMQTSTKIAIAAVVVAAAGVAGWYALTGPAPSVSHAAPEAGDAGTGGPGEAAPPALRSGPTLAVDGTPSGAFAGRTRRPSGTGEAGDESAGGPQDAGAGASPGKPLRMAASGTGTAVGSSGGSPGAVKAGRPGPAGEVSGRLLLLSDRTPIEGATVSLVPGQLPAGTRLPEAKSATSGFDGSFRLSAFPPGTWSLVATKDGFASQPFSASVLEGSGEEGIEILLAAAGAIEGKVTNALGDPAVGLALRCERASGMSGPPVAFARTDGEGAYRFPALVAGTYVVVLERAPGQVQRASASVVEGKATSLDFTGGGTLRGVLWDEARKPIARAYVRAQPISAAGYESRQVMTDADGRFRIEEMQPGEWGISVQVLGTQGFVADVGKVTVFPGENDTTVDLTRTDLSGEVFGRLLSGGSGAPLTSNEVQLTLHAMETKDGAWVLGRSFHMAFADADGRFRFRALSPGHYRFSAVPLHGAVRLREEEFDLFAGEKRDVKDHVLEATKTGTVKFVVKDEAGSPVLNASFAVGTGAGTWTINPGNPEPGTYTARLEAGTREVHLSRAGLADTKVAVDVKEGETVLVEVVLHPETPPK